jgi:ElaB/YqjD/DUF883 family membrane-anchored ribosome-binding protein
MPEQPGTIQEREVSPVSIQRSIEQAREEIASSMLALRDRVNQVVDWRGWVHEKPRLTGGLAFSLGMILGMFFRKKRGMRSTRESSARRAFLYWLKS